jgi:hypothetical protein
MAVILLLGSAATRAQCTATGTQHQPAGPNVEAADIQYFTCNDITYLVYTYTARPGARLVRFGQWNGMKNYANANEAIADLKEYYRTDKRVDGEFVELTGALFDKWKLGTMTPSDWCVATHPETDASGKDVETCLCADPNRLGHEDSPGKRVIFVAQVEECPWHKTPPPGTTPPPIKPKAATTGPLPAPPLPQGHSAWTRLDPGGPPDQMGGCEVRIPGGGTDCFTGSRAWCQSTNARETYGPGSRANFCGQCADYAKTGNCCHVVNDQTVCK